MSHHPLTNLWNTKVLSNKPKFNDVDSRNNLPKIKDGAYVINLDESESIRTHWIALYVNDNNRRAPYNLIYFNRWICSKKVKKFIGDKNIMTTIYRIQANNSIICGYFFNEFTDLLLKDKSLVDYTNLFSPDDYERSDKIILKYFK